MTEAAPETSSVLRVRRAAEAMRNIGCETILPGDEQYDASRRPWNRRLDPRPALIVRPHSSHHMRTAVTVARDLGLPLAPQSTGHGTEVPCDGGMLVLTTGMSQVTVDPGLGVARVGAGARMADVVAATRRHGLVPIVGHGEVGAAGFVLGGGIGWLSRARGLAADHLLRARLVTADGAATEAGEDTHRDLLWALRGGGGNFGVVTSLDLRLHAVADAYVGSAVYGIDQGPSILRRYREWTQSLSDTDNVGVVLSKLPAGPGIPENLHHRPVVVVRGLFLASDEEARRRLRPLLGEAGRPLFGGFRRHPVADLAASPSVPTARYQHADLFHELSDGVIDVIVSAVVETAVSTVELRLWGGALGRSASTPGPAGHRDVRYSTLAEAPADAAPDLASLAERLQPYATGGTFLNFLSDVTRTSDAFTPENHARLVALKRRYDPDNFFRLNHNIAP